MKKYKILVAGLFHETHSFLDSETTWSDFWVREGGDMLAVGADASPLGGVIEFAASHDWELVPTLAATAVPSGQIANAAIEEYFSRFAGHLAGLRQQHLDGVFLVLHGACTSASYWDVEGELLQRLRGSPVTRELPIFGVYDLHANFTRAMAEHADGLLAYRENPHSDARQAAIRAAGLLHRCLESGMRPRQYVAQPRVMWPPTGLSSACDPMRRLLHSARRLEREHPDIWAINVNAGFAYADTPETGVSLGLITSGSAAEAESALVELSGLVLDNLADGQPQEQDLDAVVDELQHLWTQGELRGLTLIVEAADNIGGGAPGDGTAALRRLVASKIPRAAACLWDPAAVSAFRQVNVGESLKIELGGRGSRLAESPLNLECRLVGLYSGRFELHDKQSHLASLTGDWFDMGPCAVVQHAGTTILLTSNATPPMDLGQWYHVGLDPCDFLVMTIKAAVSHRRAYDAIAARQIWVDSPGPCSSRLETFPYRNLRRPIFPLDPPEAILGRAAQTRAE